MTSAKEFLNFPTGNLCNASAQVRPVSSAIQPLIPGRRFAGPAKTARIRPGQNAAIHRAVHTANSGDVLVVDGGGSEQFGPFGDLLAENAMKMGIVGAVFDCTIRDAADIRALGFQVFCRGFHPEATAKDDPGEIDIELMFDTVHIRPGDIIVGDDDGVVVVPFEVADTVLKNAAGVQEREAEIRARLQAGETTYDIFALGGN